MNVLDITEEELESLRYYTSRKRAGILDMREYGPTNDFLRKINRGIKSSLPSMFRSAEEFENYLEHIDNLLSLSCKYGATHEIPVILFRGYNGASRIKSESKMTRYGENSWMSDQFLSCSRSEGETRTFSELETMVISTSDGYASMKQIPFIDVNNLLGSSQFYGDEKEILIPPFVEIMFRNMEFTRTKTYYDLDLMPWIKRHDDVSLESEQLTDEDIKRYYELSCEYFKNENKGVSEELDILTRKIKTFLHNRMMYHHYKYMVENIMELDDMFDKGTSTSEDVSSYGIK